MMVSPYASRPRNARGAPRVLSSLEARKRWLQLCEAAQAVGRQPGDDGAALRLQLTLRGLAKDSFPLPTGDVRKAWAVELHGQSSRMAGASSPTRWGFCASLLALADDVEKLLRELGSAEAADYRARTGQRDD